MSSERIEILHAWQDASYLERDHLVAARDGIRQMLHDVGAIEQYPRLRIIDAMIVEVDRSIAQRDQRIASLSKRAVDVVEPSRLTTLLRRQDEAQGERAELVSARDAIQREADAAGQVDLDDEQDRRFRALTREIADVDGEIADRDQEIETLAALHGTAVV